MVELTNRKHKIMSTAFTGVDDETQEMIGDMFSGSDTGNDNFEFDTSEVSESDLKSSGMVDRPGNYHFEVTKVELNLGSTVEGDNGTPKDNTPHVLVTCMVLQTVANQAPAGTILFHRIYVGGKHGAPAKKGSIDAMYRFAFGLGLMKWANVDGVRKLVTVATGTTKFSPTIFSGAVGRQFFATVKTEKSNDPKYEDKHVIPMGAAYNPNHPDVAHFAKNADKLKAGGYIGAATAPAAAASATTAPAATAPAAAAPTKQEADPWGIGSL